MNTSLLVSLMFACGIFNAILPFLCFTIASTMMMLNIQSWEVIISMYLIVIVVTFGLAMGSFAFLQYDNCKNIKMKQVATNAGIATAIQALLVSPSFLFLFEQDPENSKPGTVHPISDIEFASRLALFLWSSLPDDELLAAANKGVLRQPKILKQQVNRMLNDNRAIALTENFAGQWLYLRNLEYQRPDVFEFPEFDVPLRQAMLDESEWFFADIVRNNASLLNFIRSDYTFINERLARHYNIENVSGPAMRKVELSPSDGRGGLLGQGSILTVTSYGNHTSAVKRGKWILDNLLAASPPPPPPNIPALVAKQGGKELNAREQMALHREDPACAGCHSKMDPLGLSLENFDAVGAYRQYDTGRIIDSSAVMPDGTQFEALSGLQDILLQQKDQLIKYLVELLKQLKCPKTETIIGLNQ